MRLLEAIAIALLVTFAIAVPLLFVFIIYMAYVTDGWGGVWLMLIVLWIMIK